MGLDLAKDQKDKFNAIIKERVIEQEHNYRMQKEARSKEQEFITKIALQDQKIELLEI